MKKRTFQNIKNSVLITTLVLLVAGCADMLNNPLKDKDTGEDVNLLIIDFNFFTTRMSYRFVDAKTGELITSPATVNFSGKNASDIVTFSGEKRPSFSTSEGQLELTVDPNVEITESSPFEFAATVEIDGYNTLTKTFQLQNEGKKTFDLELSKISNSNNNDLNGDVNINNDDTTIVFSQVVRTGLKSVNIDTLSYKINYTLTVADFLKLTDENDSVLFHTSGEVVEAYNNDPDHFSSMSVSTFADYPPGIEVIDSGGVLRPVLFHKLETGHFEQLVVSGRQVHHLNGAVISSTATWLDDPTPDIFGFVKFGESNWNFLGTETVYDSLNFSYTLAKASNEELCETGCSISFSADVISSFSINADLFDENDKLITKLTFKGNFPETFVLENMPSRAGKLVFKYNNPSFDSIPPVIIDNLCNGDYAVEITGAAGYSEYQIVLQAHCADNPTIAVAPTYNGEIKIKGSDLPWQGVDMVGGVIDLLGKPNQEYQLRILWEEEWEYSTFFTEFDENGNYYHDTDSHITTEVLDDGRIRINVEKTFSQSVCNTLGW